MISLLHLSEQHILEHNARLLQHDVDDVADARELERRRRARRFATAAQPVNGCRQVCADKASPLCICDALGQSLERLVELFDRSCRCNGEGHTVPRRSVHLS